MLKKAQLVTLQVLNIVFFVAAVAANALAVTLPLNGKTTQALSDAYPNLFVPSGLTFSVWGVIYIMLALFCLYQAGAFHKKGTFDDRVVAAIGPWFIISSLANFAWIFAWHYEIVWLSMIFMLILLASLIVIAVRLNKIKDMNLREKFFGRAPFSIYFGWISVATIANFTALFVKYNWDGFGLAPEIWTVIVVAVALLLTLLQLTIRYDIAYSLVVIWALTGILIRPDIMGGAHYSIFIMVIGSIALIVLGIIYAAIRIGLANRKKAAAIV
jgi:hypothetical protein